MHFPHRLQHIVMHFPLETMRELLDGDLCDHLAILNNAKPPAEKIFSRLSDWLVLSLRLEAVTLTPQQVVDHAHNGHANQRLTAVGNPARRRR
jgi:hypothetical protein